MGMDVGTALEQELPPGLAAYLLQPPVPVAALASPAWEHGKRAFDVVLAVVLLLVLAPLLALVAVVVRLDSPGSPVFRQERYGRGCHRFTILKFRTMCDGASPEVHRRYIAALAAAAEGDGRELKKLSADPRVTRVGAFLRRTSLDELPQLVNVIKGEMSIVGPRPALGYELEHYAAEHFERFDVRPGITGLWQVSGRNAIGFVGMLDLDAEYAQSASPRVDAMILLRTPLAVVRGNAA
jgi:lipopolysaccharide/colanic/teichoic acid biosynthesis glycosyltransferase